MHINAVRFRWCIESGWLTYPSKSTFHCIAYQLHRWLGEGDVDVRSRCLVGVLNGPISARVLSLHSAAA